MALKIFGVAACMLIWTATAHAQTGALGKSVFENKGNCISCHGRNGSGTPFAPSLRDTVWLNIDGSLRQVRQLVRAGVKHPKKYPGMMPPMGGAQLAKAELDAVAGYVVGLRKSPPAEAAIHDHSDSLAVNDTVGGCGCCAGHRSGHGAQRGMHRMRGMQHSGERSHEN